MCPRHFLVSLFSMCSVCFFSSKATLRWNTSICDDMASVFSVRFLSCVCKLCVWRRHYGAAVQLLHQLLPSSVAAVQPPKAPTHSISLTSETLNTNVGDWFLRGEVSQVGVSLTSERVNTISLRFCISQSQPK